MIVQAKSEVMRPRGLLRFFVLAELKQALGMRRALDVGPFGTWTGDPCVLHAVHPICQVCAAHVWREREAGRPTDFWGACWKCHFKLNDAQLLGSSDRARIPFTDHLLVGGVKHIVHFGDHWTLEATRDDPAALLGAVGVSEVHARFTVGDSWPFFAASAYECHFPTAFYQGIF